MSSEVPEGWQLTSLSAAGRWLGGGTPSKAVEACWNKRDLPWVSPKDVKSNEITDSADWISADAVSNSATNIVPEGGILLVTRSGILRHSLPIARCARDCAINQDIKALIVNDSCYGPYVFQYLRGQADQIRHRCVKTGTTVESVDFEALKQFPLLLPPLSEQRRIAEILSSVDEAILVTEAVIEQTRKVQRALSDDTFVSRQTSDHTTWNITTFGDALDFKGGTQPPKSTFVYSPAEGFIRLLQIRDFESDDKPAYIPSSFKSSTCKDSDILIARYGASLGRILRGKSGAYNVALVKVIQKTTGLDMNFVYHWLRSAVFQNHLKSVGNRSAQDGFNKEDLAPLEILHPGIAEQKRIAEALDSLDAAVGQSLQKLSELKILKSALMSDLLTGRKRVTETLAHAAE